MKIDRGFVARLAAGSKEAAVVRSIVGLGGMLGKAVVAEGIDSEAQLELLRGMGCGFGQGDLMARRMPAEAVTRALTGRSWHSAWRRDAPVSSFESRMLH